jgi:superfamily I DNA/RNA helicase
LKLIFVDGIDPASILATTFTRKAASDGFLDGAIGCEDRYWRMPARIRCCGRMVEGMGKANRPTQA